jgi:hypothetical protein
MKKINFILLMIVGPYSFCQEGYNCTINFDTVYNCQNPGYPGDSAWFDTTTYINHMWQIGVPQKIIFNGAYSFPNAIVTKLNTIYPTNDTSSFVIRQIVAHTVQWPTMLGIAGYYKINSDSLTDYGTIEFSPDNGHSWTNLMVDTIIWDGTKPVFTGNSNGWSYFSNILSELTQNTNIGDTICFKFTFISDSLQTNKEGWMLDNIGFNFVGEGIQQNVSNAIQIIITPNPFVDAFELNIIEPLDNVEFAIYDIYSRLLYITKQNRTQTIKVQRNNLSSGIYFYQLKSNGKIIKTGKIIAL